VVAQNLSSSLPSEAESRDWAKVGAGTYIAPKCEAYVQKYNSLGGGGGERVGIFGNFLVKGTERKTLKRPIWTYFWLMFLTFCAFHDYCPPSGIFSDFYQVRQGRTWSKNYKSPSSSPPPSSPTRFRILTIFLTTFCHIFWQLYNNFLTTFWQFFDIFVTIFSTGFFQLYSFSIFVIHY
jgi:hypothetical protein